MKLFDQIVNEYVAAYGSEDDQDMASVIQENYREVYLGKNSSIAHASQFSAIEMGAVEIGMIVLLTKVLDVVVSELVKDGYKVVKSNILICAIKLRDELLKKIKERKNKKKAAQKEYVETLNNLIQLLEQQKKNGGDELAEN